MSETPQVASHQPPAVDAEQIRRQLTSRVRRKFLTYGGLFAAMAVLPPVLSQWEALDSGPWRWVVYVTAPLTGVGIIGLIAVLFYLLPSAVALTRACGQTLGEYAFDTYWPRVDKKGGKSATKGRPELTLRLRSAEGVRSPLMRVVEVPRRGAWRDPWPDGIENGVWTAGDLPFGGVAFVPGSGAVLLMRPEKWDRLASERDTFGADRIARAERAGLERRVF
ncbi:hypothetical protein [Streptomyces sp. NPDC054887]